MNDEIPKAPAARRSNRVLIGNLPMESTESFIYELLSKIGEVRHVEIPCNPKNGRQLGFAHVEMANASHAMSVVQLVDGLTVQERRLSVEFAAVEKTGSLLSELFGLFKSRRPDRA